MAAPTRRIWLLSGMALYALASRAEAAPPAASARARPPHTLEEVAIMLTASGEGEVRSALESAAAVPAGDVVPMLEERVRAGLSPALLDVALDTLALLGDRATGALLADLARHRRPAVRARALALIAQVRAPEAQSTCQRGLGDLDPSVRAAAASALGTLGSPDAFAALGKALEREVEGAAAALGRVARTDQIATLTAYLGRVPLETLAPMWAALIARRDIAESERVRVIDEIAALGSDASRALASELLAGLPRDASPRVRSALGTASKKGASE